MSWATQNSQGETTARSTMIVMGLNRKRKHESEIKDLENEKAKIKIAPGFLSVKILCQGFDSRYVAVLLSLP